MRETFRLIGRGGALRLAGAALDGGVGRRWHRARGTAAVLRPHRWGTEGHTRQSPGAGCSGRGFAEADSLRRRESEGIHD
jgi:hypothetical protein